MITGNQVSMAVDIGNTQAALAVFCGSRLLDFFRLTSGLPRTGDELLPIVDHLLNPYLEDLRRSGRCVIGSVAPSQTEAWVGLMERLLGTPAFVALPRSASGLKVELLDPDSVGIDRVANAVAAAALYSLPAIVVDLGTATTFDVILPGPRYVGGAIAPGIITSAENLFRQAARLAKVEIQAPDRTLGKSTAESIRSGVFFGAVEQIDGLVRRLRRELDIRPLVLATGGLASSIAAESRTIRKVDPALTVQGLRIIGEQAMCRQGLRRKCPPRAGRKK